MSTPFASIGGLASGLDTAVIVSQLMALERQPMVLLQQRKAQFQKVDDAWAGVVTRLSSLRSTVNAITDPAWLAKTATATTSNSAVATAKVSGAATNGALTFRVDALARAHQVAVGTTYGSPDATVGQGSITLHRNDGTEVTVPLEEGATLADAARALDRQTGVSARVLRTGDGAYRLIVTADKTGAAAAFSATSSVAALQGTHVLTQGQDAQLSLGDLAITRDGNVIEDLVTGVELRLTGIGEVTIAVERDLDAAVDKVNGFVTALNGLLTHLGTVSRTSAQAEARGPLAGDPLVRSLSMQLRGALSQVVGQGDIQTLSQLGISVTRDGRVTLDQAKLREGLAAHPEQVAAILGKASAATDPRVEVTATGKAAAGNYEIRIDTAARLAAVTGATYTPPGPGYPKTFRVSLPTGESVEITLSSEHDDIAAAVQHINSRLLAAGIARVKAAVAGDAIRFEADRAGSLGSFTIDDVDGAADLGFLGLHAGQDAAATLSRDGDSWALTGAGRTVTVSSGPAAGLVVRVPLDVDGEVGAITVGDGLGAVLDHILKAAEGSGGSIARARDAVQGRIQATAKSIEAFENRLGIRERAIRRQFTALESAMAQMAGQANWLASQLMSMKA